MSASETTLFGLTVDENIELAETVRASRRDYERDGMTRAFTYLARRHSADALRSLIASANGSTQAEAYLFAQIAQHELRQREGADAAVPDLNGATTVTLDTVQPERVEPLWKGYIHLAKINVLDGDPGLGKTTAALDLVARVTRGLPMPDGSHGLHEPASVVLLTAEDGLGDTIRPRLDAAGADASRVIAITGVPDGVNGDMRPVELPLDLHYIERVVLDHDAVLVIIDPLMAFLGGTTNSYQDHDVRRALAPISLSAERTGAAWLLIRHLNKSGGGHALYRGGGSIGIIGAARSGLMVVKDPEDESELRCILVSTKSNLSAPPPAMAFHIEPTADDVSRIQWDGHTSHTANQLLAMAAEDNERGDARSEAIEILQDVLSDGPRPTADVLKQARPLGITEATLRRARKQLGIQRIKEGFGEEGRWLLALPETPKALTNTLTRSSNTESALGKSERLRDNEQKFCPLCEVAGVRSLIPLASMDHCHECTRELERAAS